MKMELTIQTSPEFAQTMQGGKQTEGMRTAVRFGGDLWVACAGISKKHSPLVETIWGKLRQFQRITLFYHLPPITPHGEKFIGIEVRGYFFETDGFTARLVVLFDYENGKQVGLY